MSQANKKFTLFSFLLILITLLTYINILPNKMFFDDEELIYKNAFVSDLGYFPKYFSTNMIAGAGKISNMYRPILITSFALDHQIWGNNPLGFHLTSILLHIINVILVLILIKILFNNSQMAFLTALLFAVHPAYSEAVIYASGRTDPLYVFFGLSSVITFLKSVKGNHVNILLYFSSIILFILSLLSKEAAIIIPLLMILSLFVLVNLKNRELNLTKFLLIVPSVLVAAVYFFLRLTFLNFNNTLNFYTGTTLTPETSLYSSSIFIRFFTFTKVFFSYIAILIFPSELAVSRSVQIITSPLNFWVLLFLVFVIFAVIYSISIFKENKILLFSLFWFLIALIPASGIIPINNIFAEHYLYLPSISFFLLISFLVKSVFKRMRNSKLQPVCLGLFTLIVVLLSARTIARAFDWRDAISFYTISLKQSPDNIPMQNNLAMAYQDAGQTQKAIDQYRFIIARADFYPNTHHNLANAYFSLGKYSEAETEYYNALKIDPNFYFSYYGLAELYQKTGETEKLQKVMEVINQHK